MDDDCPHHRSNASEGEFLAGHCPQCLLRAALDSGHEDTAEWEAEQAFSESGRSAPEAFSFTPGTTLGDRFRLIARIGLGGMGEVYRADDLRLGQPVALKFLPAEFSNNAEALRRLSNEVRLGRQIAHPNVCRLYDLSEAEGQHFIVMELIDGEDLASLLARIGRLPGRRAMEMAHDLCAGLAACHERRVIHGDLKPGNVMIDGRGRARLMDFGLSTIFGTRPEDRQIAGTLAYMAPEQFRGSGISVHADLYSLGLVLYEMFTGRRVHDVRTIEQLKIAIESPPPPPSTITRIPRPVEDMILRCLEPRPARRPRFASEVASVFPSRDPLSAALAAGETPTPAMVAASEEVGDLPLRTGWMLLAAGILGLLVTTAVAERLTAIGRTAFRENPAVLAQRCREIAKAIAYPFQNADEAYGFTTRGKLRSRNDPPNSYVAFFYRQSSRALTPVESLRRIGPYDPPLDSPGMMVMGLNPEGRLRFMRVLPPETDPGQSVPPSGWEKLYGLAALEEGRSVVTDSLWIPPVPYQEKREWNAGALTGGTPAVRAAMLGGRAVYFDVMDDATGWQPEVVVRTDRWRMFIQSSHVVLVLVIGVAAGLVAFRNNRQGRTDLRGAYRVAGWVLLCRLLYWLFSSDHIGLTGINVPVIGRGLGQALFEGFQVWLAYLALEPFVRRRWPRLIIGWNRLIDGRFTNPLVGRDFLVGGLFGILLVLVEQLRGWSTAHLGLSPTPPHPVTLEMLSGAPEVVAAIFYCQARALIYAFLGLFMFLLIRAIVSRPSIAGTLWILAAAVTWSRSEHPGMVLAVAFTVAIVQAVLSLLILVRFGLLASVMMFFTYLMLVIAPLTFELRSWYAFASFVPLLGLAGLLAYSFHSALGRKPLFGRRILEG